MSRESNVLRRFPALEGHWTPRKHRALSEILRVQYDRLGLNAGSLPFSPADATAGSESELQTVVAGNKNNVDLPLIIEQSNYFANTKRRAKAGDTSRKVMTDLEKYLNNNPEGVWENSWVRFPRHKLGDFAKATLQQDLMADKANIYAGQRSDIGRFLFDEAGTGYVRVPISYLLKLSLAEIVTPGRNGHTPLHRTGLRVMENFQNDNTSPETSSFYVVSPKSDHGPGRAVAREMAVRFLLTQLLVEYANKKYGLEELGQKAMIFLSPHPPIRQKMLSDSVSDAFYRELFMNPCLSGWERGEDKYRYMHLCHRVLSRSQFNAVLKLREAGIITSNLVSLPNLSNISLANNGIHVSLGSARLTGLLQDPSSGFTARDEKYVGDLVVKIVEHFLPLFVGTYSAAPYRMNFEDFHPEKALGFLPHELDYTHLRMFWRRWRKKADVSIFGKSVTPFGPQWIDRLISKVFRLKGDFIPDFRLMDYLVVLMSTDQSPALNGEINNSQRLKADLADLGVFDAQMSLYLLEKLRECHTMGFSGFEGRHYSLFENFTQDMGPAVNLQNLLYLLAFKYMVTGQIDHQHIPDDPSVESERRQVFFGSAVGLPTFFVRSDTGNALLKKIIARAHRVRMSRRYPGYLRIHNLEYRRALLRVLYEDAADLIEMLGMRDDLADLDARLNQPEIFSACGRLTRGILDKAGAGNPLSVSADVFNRAAETYYRTDLKNRHVREAFQVLAEDLTGLEEASDAAGQEARALLYGILKGKAAGAFLKSVSAEMTEGAVTAATLEKTINMVLVQIHDQIRRHKKKP